MSVDETDLLAYVDGLLTPKRRAEVEAAVAGCPELAASLAAMRASVLPYDAAYAARPPPAVPSRLSARIRELVDADSRRQQRHTASWPRLTTAFAAGVACCAIALTLLSNGSFTSTAARVSPWIQAVADYQQLYTRETVANLTEDPRLTERIISELQVADGMNVRVPDLRSHGLTFKRVQRLSLHRQPVVQMVYLPEHGEPIAVCVTRDARPDEAPHARQIDELSTVAWRRGNLGYVVLGKVPAQELLNLAQRLASDETGSLYGQGSGPAPASAA